MWTEKDINLLIEQYSTATKEQLIEIFPNKTYKAISAKASKLGLHKIPKEIPHKKHTSPRSKYSKTSLDQEIVRLYIDENLPMWKVAETLNISVGKVFNRLHAIGIKPKSHKDYPVSDAVIKHSQQIGKAQKGILMTDEQKIKLAESKFVGGVGHKKLRKDGYVAVYFPEHPMANKDGYIMEHDLVMSCVLGRHFTEDEVVHHKNHVRDDNRVCNLQVMTASEHAALHARERHEIQTRIKENNYEH